MSVTAKCWPSCVHLTNGVITPHAFGYGQIIEISNINMSALLASSAANELDGPSSSPNPIFELIQKQGKQHGKPDALSRRPDYDKVENNNDERNLLTAKHFRELTVEVESVGDETTVEDPKTEGTVRENVWKRFEGREARDGLISWKNRVYVPRDNHLRDAIIHPHHDRPLRDIHPG